jgi:tetratricopeptide (TPR) repeat protein/tRNA A-37 threonylcarbamoyl transferase component Bud32
MTDVLDRLRAALADRYAIEREIGSGGMATVYLAEDLKLHRKVAVKVLKPDLAAALGPERFLQEIEIAAQLHHPHILPLHDSGDAEGFLYYVMPYEEGQSLREKLAREGELPIAEAVRILRDVVDALTHAQKHNVVHRDIKPDNVMLSDRHALVTDFGVAKAVSEATGRQKLTTEGIALGTPAYMAPEQAAADPHIDHRADIYAVGAVAYELLTGRPPFTGTTQQEILAAHVTQAPEPVTKFRESVPPALEQLVMKCLEKKAADRWQSAEELLPVLEALGTPSGGITPTGTQPTTAVAPGAGRRWRTVAAAAVVVALLGLGGWWILRGSEPASLAAINTIPRAWMILADFDGLDEDPGMRDMVEEVVRAGMDRSNTVEVVPGGELRRALGRAGYDDSVRVTEEIARELALRSDIATVLTGRVSQVGNSLSLVIRVVEAERGRQLASTQGTVRTESFIDDVGEMTDELRSQIGDLPSGRHSDRPLSSITTPSFEALEAYREGRRLYDREQLLEAREWFDRALELDSLFTNAYYRKGYTYWGSAPDSVDAYIQRALATGDRVSPRMRTYLSTIAAWNNNDLQTAVNGFERMVLEGGRHDYDLGTLYGLLNQPDVAAEWFRRRTELSPFGLHPTGVSRWYGQLFRAGRTEEARELVPLLDSIFPESTRLRVLDDASLDRDWDQLIALGNETAEDPAAPNWVQRQGQYAAASGHLARGEIASARTIVEDIRAEARKLDSWGWEYATYWDEVFIRLFSGLQEAPPDPPAWNPEPFGVYSAAVWAWSTQDTAAIRRSLRVLEAVPQPANSRFGEVPAFLEAMIDWHGGNWERIVDRLGTSAARGRDLGRLQLSTNRHLRRAMVAEAHRQLGRPDSAGHYLALTVEEPRSPSGTRFLGWTYSFVHFDLGALYAEAGQRERAIQHYSSFLEAFTRPDSSVTWMREQAQRELQRLAAER